MAGIDEELLDHYIEKLRQVDRLLRGPVQTLIDIAIYNLELNVGHHLNGKTRLPFYFPPWIGETREPLQSQKLALTTALCCKTLQRVWRIRRRFPEFERHFDRLQKAVTAHAGAVVDPGEYLTNSHLPAASGAEAHLRFIGESNVMDEWFPFSSAAKFWVLIGGGEEKAYTGAGVLACFAILWSIHGAEGEGASIATLPSSAYVTNYCWSTIDAMARTCRRRARLLRNVAGNLKEIIKRLDSGDAKGRYEIPFLFDALATSLHDYSPVAVARGAFHGGAQAIEKVTEGLRFDSDLEAACKHVLNILSDALRTAGEYGTPSVIEMREVNEKVLTVICEAMEPGPLTGGLMSREDLDRIESVGVKALRDLQIDLPVPKFTDPAERSNYWLEMFKAAEAARSTVGRCTEEFAKGIQACAELKSAAPQDIVRVLEALCEANGFVAAAMDKSVERAANWATQTVVPRELAFASSGDWTAFDPAELVAAAEIAVRTKGIESDVEVRVIAERTMEAFSSNSSWQAGQPFFLDTSFSNSAWTPVADTMWMLVRTLVKHPNVTSVDAQIDRFVDWLDIKKKHFTIRTLADVDLRRDLHVDGWVSERQVRPDRIDLWVTTYTINALLEIRKLIELRLWRMCKKRFAIVPEALPLENIDAVDLGARHGRRLHFQLARMSRQTGASNYKSADYSMVLHGPPGSSKTVIAGAVAGAMWRHAQDKWRDGLRFIRITPADFTRMGEDRIDFEARQIFELLSHVRGVTILFDEIDDLLRKRDSRQEVSFLKLIVPAMLNRLQDLRDRCPIQEISFLIATNYIDNIEPALIRKGRIDRLIPLVYPDRHSRTNLIEGQLEGAGTASWVVPYVRSALLGENISRTDFWPFKTVQSACREILRDAAAIDPRGAMDVPGMVERIVAEHQASVSPAYECDRLAATATVAPLRDEVLTYLLAGASKASEYLDVVDETIGAVVKPVPQVVRARAQQIWEQKLA